MKKFFAFACVAIIGFFVGRYMFPANEFELHDNRYPLKINKRTGETWMMRGKNWIPMENYTYTAPAKEKAVTTTNPSSFIPVTDFE